MLLLLPCSQNLSGIHSLKGVSSMRQTGGSYLDRTVDNEETLNQNMLAIHCVWVWV
jgi:hypothetical protein